MHNPICRSCESPLAADAPDGLCPACLLKAGLAADEPTLPDADSAATRSMPGVAPAPSDGGEAGIPALFPELEILGLIGRGGMGVVYRARQKNLDRMVALKVLPAELADRPGFADRFQREARALARLAHPGIVAIYDHGQRDGRCYLIMELVDGPNLRQMIAAGRITPPVALGIVPRVCEALQYAHDEGVVHRDIKPENILVDKRGRVKIADFGLAKLTREETPADSLTRTGAAMGTPRYMAPEQFQDTKGVDHRADIYSLGVVFYEMLTGELPLGRFAPPSRKVRVDVRLDEVVLRTLESEPALRYQHASEVKTDVESITRTDGAPAVAAPATVVAPVPSPAQNPPPAVPARARGHGHALIAGGALLLLGAFAGFNVVACNFEIYHPEPGFARRVGFACTLQFAAGMAALVGGIQLLRGAFSAWVPGAAWGLCAAQLTIPLAAPWGFAPSLPGLLFCLWAAVRVLRDLRGPGFRATLREAETPDAHAGLAASGAVVTLVCLTWGLFATAAGPGLPGRFDMLIWLPGLVTALAAAGRLIRSSAGSARQDAIPELVLAALAMGVAALPWQSLIHPIPDPWGTSSFMARSAWERPQGAGFSALWFLVGFVLLVSGGRPGRPLWRPLLTLGAGFLGVFLALHLLQHPLRTSPDGFWRVGDIVYTEMGFQLPVLGAFLLSFLHVVVGALQLRNRPVTLDRGGSAAAGSLEGKTEARADPSPQAVFLRSILWLVVIICAVMFCWFENVTYHGSNGYSVLRVGAVSPWLIVGRDTPNGHYITPNFATASAFAGLCAVIAASALFSMGPNASRSAARDRLQAAGRLLWIAGLLILIAAVISFFLGLANVPTITEKGFPLRTSAVFVMLVTGAAWIGITGIIGGAVMRQRRFHTFAVCAAWLLVFFPSLLLVFAGVLQIVQPDTLALVWTYLLPNLMVQLACGVVAGLRALGLLGEAEIRASFPKTQPGFAGSGLHAALCVMFSLCILWGWLWWLLWPTHVPTSRGIGWPMWMALAANAAAWWHVALHHRGSRTTSGNPSSGDRSPHAAASAVSSSGRRHALCAALLLVVVAGFLFGLSFNARSGGAGAVRMITVGALDPLFVRESGPTGFRTSFNLASWSFLALVLCGAAFHALVRVLREDEGKVPRDPAWWRDWWKQFGIWGGLLLLICVVRTLRNPGPVLTPAQDRPWSLESSSPTGPLSYPRYLEGHQAPVKAVAISPDGNHLLSAGLDGQLITRTLPMGSLRSTWRTAEREMLRTLAVSPDGEWAYAAGDLKGDVFRQRIPGGANDPWERLPVAVDGRSTIQALHALGNDRLALLSVQNRELVFLDLPGASVRARVPLGGTDRSVHVHRTAASPDGRFVALLIGSLSPSASTPGVLDVGAPCQIRIFNRDGESVHTLADQPAGSDFAHTQIAFGGDETFVVCVPSGKLLRLNLGTDMRWEANAAWTTIPPARYSAAAASADGNTVWLAADREIMALDTRTGAGVGGAHVTVPETPEPSGEAPIQVLAPGPNGLLAIGLRDGRVVLDQPKR